MTFSKTIVEFVWLINIGILGILLLTMAAVIRKIYRLSRIDDTVVDAEYFYASIAYMVFNLGGCMVMMFINIPAAIKHHLFYFTYKNSSDTSISVLTFIDRYAMVLLALLGNMGLQKLIVNSFITILKKILPVKFV